MRAGWSEEEINNGCQEGRGGMGGMDMNEVLAAMLAARASGLGGMPGFAFGTPGVGGSAFPGAFPARRR